MTSDESELDSVYPAVVVGIHLELSDFEYFVVPLAKTLHGEVRGVSEADFRELEETRGNVITADLQSFS